ncbi:MAG: hypothetical protein M1476_02125 [Candidatus Thermoplasmatota archaeon]|nr:hypothetical protein [Candidatus Thermoplasmatota archaeon]
MAVIVIAVTGMSVSTGVVTSSSSQPHPMQSEVSDSQTGGMMKEITKGKEPNPAPGSTLKVNAVAKVINDEDSGYQGYWAIDNYTLNAKIWVEPNGTFFFALLYRGTATTYAGVPAPGLNGTENGKGVAHFSGYVTGWFTGTFNPLNATHGFLGTFNYGGSPSFLGAYSSAKTPLAAIDWLAQYFPGYSVSSETFSFTYFYQGQVWVDAFNVSPSESGNIIVS